MFLCVQQVGEAVRVPGAGCQARLSNRSCPLYLPCAVPVVSQLGAHTQGAGAALSRREGAAERLLDHFRGVPAQLYGQGPPFSSQTGLWGAAYESYG